MGDYIAREDARAFAITVSTSFGSIDAVPLDELDELPAADVTVVRHGRWVHGKEVGRKYLGDCLAAIFYDRWTCSECEYVVDDHAYSGINYKFCPKCGAKMTEVDADADTV